MNKMPYAIKQKLRQISTMAQKFSSLQMELGSMFDDYDVEMDFLTACMDTYEYPIQTEALAQIIHAEPKNKEELEYSIQEIENVFLYYANKRKGDICE